jgi:hypothetical protein
LVNPNTRTEITRETGRVILLGINKYENIKYIARPETKAPGIANILLYCIIEVKQSFLVIIIYSGSVDFKI